MTEAEELEAVEIGKREIKAMHAAFEAVAAWADDGAADTPDDVVEQIIPLLRHVYSEIDHEEKTAFLLAFLAAYMRGLPMFTIPEKQNA
jgi:hypothetical protein